MSAKREETRLKRLNTLIEDSANGVKIKQMRRAGSRQIRNLEGRLNDLQGYI